MEFFREWEIDRYTMSDNPPGKELPPDTTLRDLESAVKGMEWLLLKAEAMGASVTPYRISQDVCENWFGHQRQAGGANHNMIGQLEL